jgi:hypothetical protein
MRAACGHPHGASANTFSQVCPKDENSNLDQTGKQ